MAGPYFPLDDRPFRLRMGLRPLDLAEWLEPDDRAPEELALKRRLLEERYDDVVAVVDDPLVHAACEELWTLVSAASPPATAPPADAPPDDPPPDDPPPDTSFVLQNRPSGDDSAGQNGWDGHPIARCGSVTQEDWAVMAPVGGELVLAAACVCFPTRWVLATKIGKPMAAVHEHVAHYDEHLGRPVDSFFERLTVDRPVWRQNWNLMDDPELFQPVAKRPGSLGPDPTIGVDDVGDRVWLRVERQTLRRLPETGAIVFGIRIHQRPLSALAGAPDQLTTLRTALAALPADTFAYKGLGGFAAALDAWIARQLIN